MIGTFHHVIAINTINRLAIEITFHRFVPFLKIGTLPAASLTNRLEPDLKREDQNEHRTQSSAKRKPPLDRRCIVDDNDLRKLRDFGVQQSGRPTGKCTFTIPTVSRCQLSCLTRLAGDRGLQLPLTPRSPPILNISAKPVSTGVIQWVYFHEPATS